MNSKLNLKQWLIATGAVFIVLSILAYFVNRPVLSNWYPEQTIQKPENLMMVRVWMYLSRLLFSAIFVYLFSLGYEGKPGIGQGLRYGLWIGLLVYLPGVFSSMVVTTSPVDFLVVRGAVGVIEILIAGLVVGLIYKGQKAATA